METNRNRFVNMAPPPQDVKDRQAGQESWEARNAHRSDWIQNSGVHNFFFAETGVNIQTLSPDFLDVLERNSEIGAPVNDADRETILQWLLSRTDITQTTVRSRKLLVAKFLGKYRIAVRKARNALNPRYLKEMESDPHDTGTYQDSNDDERVRRGIQEQDYLR